AHLRSGSGLAICQSLVARMGGALSVESSPRRSSAEFWVPARPARVSGFGELDGRREALRGRKILVVSAEPWLRSHWSSMLSRLLLAVTAAPPERALKLAQAISFEALVVDGAPPPGFL